MGAKNQIGFVRTIERGSIAAGLSPGALVRIQIARSQDGTEGGPSHAWVDVHSHYDETEEVWVLDDEPINERDLIALRMFQRLCIMAGMNDGLRGQFLGDALRGVMRWAWGESVTDHIMNTLTEGETDMDALVAVMIIERANGVAAGVTP